MAVRQRSRLCRQNLLAKERIESGGATRLRVDATSEQFLRSPVTHESLFLGLVEQKWSSVSAILRGSATITDRQKLSAMYLAARIQPERCIGCPAERSPPRTQPVRSISGLEAAFSAASAALGSRRRSRLAAALAVLQLCGGWECGLRHVRTC